MENEVLNLWKVYIIQTESGKLYTGITNNLERRFAAHQNQQKGARFFHFSSPQKIVFQESHPNRSEASKREIAVKKMSRKEKLELIESMKKGFQTDE
jgi:putative endonuclease